MNKVFNCSKMIAASSVGFVFRTGISRLPTARLSSSMVPIDQLESNRHAHNGLLSGLSNISSSNHYSMNIPLVPAAELVKNNRLLYDIIEKECASDQSRIEEYIRNIFKQMNTFMKANKVWDRAELINGLNMTTETAGNFVCLLGGKSTGKSLVLDEFSRKENGSRNVIYVDMRSGYTSITHGFLSVISKGKNRQLLMDMITHGFLSVISKGKNRQLLMDMVWALVKKFLAPKVKIMDQIEIDFNPFLDVIKTEERPADILLGLLTEMTEKLGAEVVMTLVVDEANLPLTINGDTSQADIKGAKENLALFTRLTKQNKMVKSHFFLSYLFPS
jgi:hypothetical protein